MHEILPWICIAAAIIVAPKLYYLIQVGRRRKGEIRFRARRILVAFSCYIGGILVVVKMGYTPKEAIAFAFVFGIATTFVLVRPPSRSRVIPKSVRRAVIERDLKGERFDPNIHHIDHIVPYSRGGDHSVANLRVLPKKDNLRRGARMPTFDDIAPPIVKRLRKVNY